MLDGFEKYSGIELLKKYEELYNNLFKREANYADPDIWILHQIHYALLHRGIDTDEIKYEESGHYMIEG